MSHFVYYYLECHCVECHYAECHYAECHYAECHYAECHYAECHYAECHYAEYFNAECHFPECHGTFALPPEQPSLAWSMANLKIKAIRDMFVRSKVTAHQKIIIRF